MPYAYLQVSEIAVRRLWPPNCTLHTLLLLYDYTYVLAGLIVLPSLEIRKKEIKKEPCTMFLRS